VGGATSTAVGGTPVALGDGVCVPGGGGGEVIIGGPLDQAAERRLERGKIVDAEQRAQAIVADLRIGGHMLRLPDDAGILARAERGEDDRAGLDVMLRIDAVIERPERGIEQEDAGALVHGCPGRVSRGKRESGCVQEECGASAPSVACGATSPWRGRICSD